MLNLTICYPWCRVTEYYDAENGETKPFCSNMLLDTNFRMYYSLALLVIQYIFPLIILSGAYIHMTTKLWGTQIPGNKEESRDAIVLRNKKKVKKINWVCELWTNRVTDIILYVFVQRWWYETPQTTQFSNISSDLSFEVLRLIFIQPRMRIVVFLLIFETVKLQQTWLTYFVWKCLKYWKLLGWIISVTSHWFSKNGWL